MGLSDSSFNRTSWVSGIFQALLGLMVKRKPPFMKGIKLDL